MGDNHKKLTRDVKKETKMVLQDKLAMNEIQSNPELKAQLGEQMKNVPPTQGGKRPTIVVYYNDVKLKKKKNKKKKKKTKKASKEQSKEKVSAEKVEEEKDDDPPPANFDPVAEGYQIPDAVVLKGYAGIPIVVPIDCKEETKLAKAKGTKTAAKGWIRKTPNGVPAWKEAKGAAKPPQAIEGSLIKDGNNWSVFVPVGVDVSAEGNPVIPAVQNSTGKDIPEVMMVGESVPLSGTVTVENDGSLQFTKRDLKAEEGGAVVAEGRPPEAVMGALIKDKTTKNVIFLTSDDYGVGAALGVEKAQAEKTKDDDKPEVGTQQPLGSVLADVVKRGENIQTVRADSVKPEEKWGVLIQTTNAPMYVQQSRWEDEKRNATQKLKGKNPDQMMIQQEATKAILNGTSTPRAMVDLADQIYRAKLEGKSLEDIQKLDAEEKALRDKEMAEERAKMMEDYKKMCEGTSKFYNEAGRNYDAV